MRLRVHHTTAVIAAWILNETGLVGRLLCAMPIQIPGIRLWRHRWQIVHRLCVNADDMQPSGAIVAIESMSTFSTAFARYVGRSPKSYARERMRIRSEAA